jgi:hypothetical protein
MDITSVITLLFANNGISLEIGLILLMAACSVLMSIQDYRISLISLFLGSAILIVTFTIAGLDTLYITYTFLISIILLAFSIFATRQGGQLMG